MKASGRSLRSISHALGLSLSRVWRILHGAGLGPGRTGLGEDAPRRRRRNALEAWISAHPDVELPPTLRELSALTGISSRYLSGMVGLRRRRLEAWAAGIGDLHARVMILRVEDGTRVSTPSLSRWEWKLDPIRGTAALEVTTICGEVFLVPIPDRWEWALEWRRSPRREGLA